MKIVLRTNAEIRWTAKNDGILSVQRTRIYAHDNEFPPNFVSF